MKALLFFIAIYFLIPFAIGWLAGLAVKLNRVLGFVAGAILLVAPLAWVFGHTSEEWYGGAWLEIIFFFFPLMLISVIGLGTMYAAVFKRAALAGEDEEAAIGAQPRAASVPAMPRDPHEIEAAREELHRLLARLSDALRSGMGSSAPGATYRLAPLAEVASTMAGRVPALPGDDLDFYFVQARRLQDQGRHGVGLARETFYRDAVEAADLGIDTAKALANAGSSLADPAGEVAQRQVEASGAPGFWEWYATFHRLFATKAGEHDRARLEAALNRAFASEPAWVKETGGNPGGASLTPRESRPPEVEKDPPAVAAMRERLDALARDAALLHRAMAQAHRGAVAYAGRSTPHELEWLAIAAAALEENAREAAIKTPQRCAILDVQYQRLVERAREIGVVV